MSRERLSNVFCKSQTFQVFRSSSWTDFSGQPCCCDVTLLIHIHPLSSDECVNADADTTEGGFGLRMCVSCLQQSDNHYNENVPSIKIPMDMMEQEPFLGDKASDSE